MSFLNNILTKQLNIQNPIIQAPMAGGITTSKLVNEVSNQGGLGMIGAGYLDHLLLSEQIQEIKHTISGPFGVNVFVPSKFQKNEHEINNAKEILRPFFDQYGIDGSQINLPVEQDAFETYEQQIEVLLKEEISVCSFTFGVPSQEVISEFKKTGTILVGTATTVEEAMKIEEIGMDMVIVQGSEAGGHRGAFLNDEGNNLIGLMSLVPQVVDHVHIPVIASGGIMDGRGLMAAICLGAQAVQMGTAFLLTEESGAHSLHKEMILQKHENDSTLTKSFSGKLARGIKNEYTTYMSDYESVLPPFPLQNKLTQPVRKAAKENENDQLMSLWTGQSIRLGKKQSVETLMNSIISEAKEILNNFSRK